MECTSSIKHQKGKNTLLAFKLIKPYFNNKESKKLITANFYSILYYNSEVWYLPSLNPQCKQQLQLANAVKLYATLMMIEHHLKTYTHLITEQPPTQLMQYKHTLLLYKLYNRRKPIQEWVKLNFPHTLTSMQTHFKIICSNKYKIGNSLLYN